ncbi:winged helix-turn-helix domain-containing protein [Pseudoduganella armeniaca]|nr:winged helix-turn-helix domain-containing protein [Pseudoduganella armeniaca]
MSDRPPIQIGSFELWPAARRLRQHGKAVAITGRAFDVLAVLAARHPDMARKSELMTAVWPGLVVEDNNLQVQISLLRKILGRDAIATVPGFGYCLNLAVTTGAGTTGTPRHGTAGSLHGRATDLAELSELVREYRLVTLAGGPGVGKSTLARHLPAPPAAELTWIDLADCIDPTGLLQAFAGAVEAGSAGEKDSVTLLRQLGRRPGLLVLDNADRVARLLAPIVEELLAHGAVHVLVTTQVRLHLPQEHVYRLTPLAVPPHGTPLPEARQYGALDLLDARARGHDHRFALTPAVLPDAIELCRQLDGLPLALELAAARIPALGVAGVLQRMDERLTVLATSHEGVPARQRSLQDAIAWSCALLAPDERALWCETARLPTPFLLEDLIAVGPARDIGRTLDLLGTLVERGLLRFDTEPAPCYRLDASHRLFAQAVSAAPGGTERMPQKEKGP